MTRRCPAHRKRRGAFLLEVLLACGSWPVSLALLAQLGDVGQRTAVVGQLQGRAMIRCETTLNELLVGLPTVPSRPPARFRDDPDGSGPPT